MTRDALALADPGSARDRLRQMAARRPDTSITAVTADVAGRPVTIRLKLEGEAPGAAPVSFRRLDVSPRTQDAGPRTQEEP